MGVANEQFAAKITANKNGSGAIDRLDASPKAIGANRTAVALLLKIFVVMAQRRKNAEIITAGEEPSKTSMKLLERKVTPPVDSIARDMANEAPMIKNILRSILREACLIFKAPPSIIQIEPRIAATTIGKIFSAATNTVNPNIVSARFA